MLGHNFRLRAKNSQNQTITVTLTARYWKLSSTGALVYSTEQTLISAAAITAAGESASSTVDNSSNLYIGAQLTLSTTASATTNGAGAVNVTLEQSTDGGTTWSTTGLGIPVGSYTVTAADTTSARRTNLEIT